MKSKHQARRVFFPTLCTFLFFFGSAQAGEFKANWRPDWERTLEAAKQEGQVVVHAEFWGEVLDSGVFQRAYPGIRLVGVKGRGSEFQYRILAERRAGKYLVDVVSAGITTTLTVLHAAKVLDPIKVALILPEVVDESRWWQGKHHYMDPEKEYVFTFTGTPLGLVYYNTNMVNPKEFSSLWDLLTPRWKGKILVRDIRIPGPGAGSMRFLYHHPDLGPKYIRKLMSDMEATVFRDFRQGTDWLAQGKFAICLGCSDVTKAKSQGLPVDSFRPVWKEGTGVASQSGTLSLMDHAPHPNAAKIFINWLLSREGQLTLMKVLAQSGSGVPDSLRIDIPKDEVAEDNRREEGINYLNMDAPARRDMRPVIKIFEESLVEGKKPK